jgi:CheY-like chemotaxis protein
VHEVNILVVDDLEPCREAVAQVLTGQGFAVVVCSSAEEAISVLKGRGSPPSLVLTDVEMPGISGLELTRWIRRQPRYERLPVVCSSASEDPSQALAAGADRFLPKPFRRAELLASVSGLLAGVPGSFI